MSASQPDSEWSEGWRIVLGCAIASGAGIVLLFFTFNLFVLPLAAELHVTRGAIAGAQALIVTAALGALIMGRAMDRFGFKPVYLACIAMVAATMLLLAAFASTMTHLMIGVAVLGFFGIGTTSLATTRPVSAHFHRHRGRALGIVAAGVSITTLLVPPLLQAILSTCGWRAGFAALAAFGLLAGAPAAGLIVPSKASLAHTGNASGTPRNWQFLRDRDFLLMAMAMLAMGAATAGFVGQLSPVVQEEGLSAMTGAFAVSVFAAGQFAGRLGGGWLLDHFDPRRLAVVLTIIPASGFALLLLTDHMLWAALLAALLIGLQQGAELDIFAFFVARRFPLAQYGTVYGALQAVSWVGNAAGLKGVGTIHDLTGSYAQAQAIGLSGLLLGAALIWALRLTPSEPRVA